MSLLHLCKPDFLKVARICLRKEICQKIASICNIRLLLLSNSGQLCDGKSFRYLPSNEASSPKVGSAYVWPRQSFPVSATIATKTNLTSSKQIYTYMYIRYKVSDSYFQVRGSYRCWKGFLPEWRCLWSLNSMWIL